MTTLETIRCEAMLLQWSETSSRGPTITLALSDPDDLIPFKRLTLAKGKLAGQILQITAEVSDEGQPSASPPGKGGPLSILAARWCQDREFQAWLANDTGFPCRNEQEAAVAVRKICAIESRRELDHDEKAAHRYEALIRQPYMTHLQEGPRFFD